MTTAAQQGTGSAQGGAFATSLVEGDQIIVTLTATKPSSERVSISAAFNSKGQPVDNAGTVIEGPSLDLGGTGDTANEPKFPMGAYTDACRSGNASEADRLNNEFRTAMAAFRKSGGSTVAERVANAVYAYLQANHGVSDQDHDGLILKRDQVMVKAPYRASAAEGGLWVIQLAPTWGASLRSFGGR